MPGLDDDRFSDLLKLIGDLRQTMESNQAKTESQLLEQWKAASTAIRTLADWWARETDRNNKERDERRIELDAMLAAIRTRQEKADSDRLRLQQFIYMLVAMDLIVIALVIGARWL